MKCKEKAIDKGDRKCKEKLKGKAKGEGKGRGKGKGKSIGEGKGVEKSTWEWTNSCLGTTPLCRNNKKGLCIRKRPCKQRFEEESRPF